MKAHEQETVRNGQGGMSESSSGNKEVSQTSDTCGQSPGAQF